MSHDCVGFYLLAEEVSRHVKVVQSGQGADETFAGYHWHEKMLTAADPLDDYAGSISTGIMRRWLTPSLRT